MKNIRISENFQFLVVKLLEYLNRYAFLMTVFSGAVCIQKT